MRGAGGDNLASSTPSAKTQGTSHPRSCSPDGTRGGVSSAPLEATQLRRPPGPYAPPNPLSPPAPRPPRVHSRSGPGFPRVAGVSAPRSRRPGPAEQRSGRRPQRRDPEAPRGRSLAGLSRGRPHSRTRTPSRGCSGPRASPELDPRGSEVTPLRAQFAVRVARPRLRLRRGRGPRAWGLGAGVLLLCGMGAAEGHRPPRGRQPLRPLEPNPSGPVT